MSTRRIDKQYSEYESNSEQLDAKDLYFSFESNKYLDITNIYYGAGAVDTTGSRPTKQITSFQELVKHAGKDNLFLDVNGTTSVRYKNATLELIRPDGSVQTCKLLKRNVSIPTYIDSYSINTSETKIPYGLKRNVKMASAGTDKEDAFALVKIDGESKYVKKSSIYFMTPEGKQELGEDISIEDVPSGAVLYDGETGKAISEIYAGALFVPEKIVAAETIDFEALTYTYYQSAPTENGTQVVGKKVVDSNGMESFQIDRFTNPLETTFSEHRYTQKKVEGKAGKTETVSVIEAKNFVVDQGKEFIYINGDKIFLDQITGITKTVTRTEERGIYSSDLKVGKTIEYKVGDETKEIELKQEMMDSLTTDENGRKFLKINGEQVYIEDISKVSYQTSTPTKQDLEGDSTITYNVNGEEKTTNIAEGQEKVFSTAGDYVYVTSNGRGLMVPLKNLRDEHNQPIAKLEEMIGKKLIIVEEQKVGDKKQDVQVGVTDELTYEQAHLKYSTRKSFQPSEKTKADDTTYIKLASGEMVKESMINVPKAYRFADEEKEEADALIVQIGEGNNIDYVIVSKDYFETNGSTKTIKEGNAKPVVRCHVDDDRCIAVQTTSKGQEVEACKFCGKWDEKSTMTPADLAKAKNEGENLANTNIKDGSYIIDDALNREGKAEKFEPGSQRYEYTDTITIPDYAANETDYKFLQTSNLKIQDGKLVGGVKYKMGKAMKKDFSLWGNILGYSAGAVILASFIPGIGAVAMPAFLGALVAGPAVIVAKHVIKSAIKNNWQIRMGIPFKDKAKINQQKQEEQLESNIEALYEKMMAGELTNENFEHEIATLKQKAHSLSRANENSSIKVVNGTASVTKENANAAIKYKKEYQRALTNEKKLKKKLEKAKIGGFNPLKIFGVTKFGITQEEYNILQMKYNHFAGRLEALKNGEFSEQSLDDMNRNTNDFLLACKSKSQEKITACNVESENLNRHNATTKAVGKSGKFDLILDSIDDMRAVAVLNKADEKSLKDLGLTDEEIKIAQNLKYNKKLGITFEGKKLENILTNKELKAIEKALSITRTEAQQAEQQRNEYYEEMSEKEKRAQEQSAKGQETANKRAEEQKVNDQVNQSINNKEVDESIRQSASKALEELKTKDLDRLQQDKEKKMNELTDLKTNLETQQNNLLNLKTEIASKETKLGRLSTPLLMAESRFQELNNQYNGQQAILQSAKKEESEAVRMMLTASNDQQYNLANAKKESAESKINATQQELDRLQSPWETAKNNFESLKQEYGDLETAINVGKGKIVETEQLINSTSQDIVKKQQEIEDVERRLIELRTRITNYESYMERHSEASA